MGARAMWMHSRVGSSDQGWAGPGIATVLGCDEQRRFFGLPVGSGNPGPAVEIRLDHSGERIWVEPSELVELDAAGAPS